MTHIGLKLSRTLFMASISVDLQMKGGSFGWGSTTD